MGCIGYGIDDHEFRNQCIVKNAESSFVPELIASKLSESIVRIEFDNKISTGFLMKINIKQKPHCFILTNAHSITQSNIDSKTIIELFYGKANEETEKIIKLDKNKRFIKCFMDLNIDATIIEILKDDYFPENKYLFADLNYENGYDQYIETQIFTAGYPKVEKYKYDKHFSSGKIRGYKNIKQNTFCHDCSTKEGSSGSPIININQQVIGIHFGCNNQQTMNYGVFIGEIIKNLVLEEDKITFKDNNLSSNNYDDGSLTSIKPGEKIISINIVSMGDPEVRNFAIVCKNTDLFVKLEEKLYKSFPLFKNFETIFLCNGRKIFRFKTVEENHLKDNDIIQVLRYE